MPYDWTEASTAEGAEHSERLPSGIHTVTITRIIHNGKNGPFESKNGDPQILVVFSDDQAREATQMITLSQKAGWVLAKLMTNFDPPMNLTKMTEAGVTPDSFASPDFAETNLVGRKLAIKVEWEASAKGDKEYSNITPMNTGDMETAMSASQVDFGSELPI
jgi:hypothetical protein